MTEFKKSYDSNAIDWAKGDGLIPAIVQDATSLRVLMLGYLNDEALQATEASGLVTFFSRTKQRLWRKGETSGHLLTVKEIKLDCDKDTLLILAEPKGPTCHNGTQSCFGDDNAPGFGTLADLALTIRDRHENPTPGSYTARLFAEGMNRMAQKVGEEGVEVALAASTGSDTLAGEVADLLYHVSVLLEASKTDWASVMRVLSERAQAKP
jgi:phosphoribosyl-ATP pyrophosphohydrolase/phosphoribosyl-AMP cyclohydrolase